MCPSFVACARAGLEARACREEHIMWGERVGHCASKFFECALAGLAGRSLHVVDHYIMGLQEKEHDECLVLSRLHFAVLFCLC